MLMRGHCLPSGEAVVIGGVSTVHGQPALPAGGGGSSSSVGHRTLQLGNADKPDGKWIPDSPSTFQTIGP
jgi:hypothetical protein